MLDFTASVLVQGGRQDGQGKEVPPELQAKMQEFKEAVAGLKEPGALLKGDTREFRAGIKELFQEARSLPRDEKWGLFDEVSAVRDRYVDTVEEKIAAVMETARRPPGRSHIRHDRALCHAGHVP